MGGDQLLSKVPPADDFWRTPLSDLLAALDTRQGGLTQIEAANRLQRFGPNRFETSQNRSILRKLGNRLGNPLIGILLVAALVSAATGEAASFFIIVSVVVLSMTLDLIQEHRAELAADSLRRSVAVEADVFRDGKVVVLPVSVLVPGDVVSLRTGDLVPADGVVVEVHELQVNEALMTGEAFPASKDVGPSNAALAANARNALFAGTSVVGGDAVMLVVATGFRTKFGAIASALAADAPPTAIEEGIRHLGLLILRLTLFLTLFVLLAHLAAHRPAVESFLFAVALAVGLTPELLPMVMTVTLARGAERMATKQVIVKRLSAIHDLGGMDILCVDKTGTLTEARITLAAHIDCEGQSSDRVLQLARLNSVFQAGVRSPLDDAILAGAKGDQSGWTRVAEVPFDFRRRCLSVLAARDGEQCLIVKGAPEAILSRTVAVEIGGLRRPIDAEWCSKLDLIQDKYARDGFRLLGVAIRSFPGGQSSASVNDEVDLTFLGFCVFADPPKGDAAEAVAHLASLGIQLKIISGDHPAVVTHVARAVGLSSPRILTGAEIAGLTDAGVAAQVGAADLFARIDPEQKRRIIMALRRNGHVVGFMGDGVNDAPAIHSAHVGISVAGATEVARAAADIILVAPDLLVLAEGVREGRRTFANILKYVRMGTSSNFGNMLSMALASLVLPFLPLLPLQILLNNLLYDLSEIGIPFDLVDDEDVAAPEVWDMTAIVRFTVVMGTASSLFDATTFFILIKFFEADATLFHTGWFVESIVTQILVIFLIRSHRLPWHAKRPHPILIASSLCALTVGILLAIGPLAQVFGFTKMPWQMAATVMLISVAYLVTAEFVKRLALGRRPAPQWKSSLLGWKQRKV